MVVSIKLLVSIWSIAVAVFLFTRVGLFIVGIIPFWCIKFQKSCIFLLFSWSKGLRLKSPAIWCVISIEIFVILKTFFKNFSNDSVWPLGGLYKTLRCCVYFQIKVLHTVLYIIFDFEIQYLFNVYWDPTPFANISNLMYTIITWKFIVRIFVYLFHLTMSQKNIYAKIIV